MPGIYGYIKEKSSDNFLKNMTKQLYYIANFVKDKTINDRNIESSHIHIGHMKKNSDYFLKEGIYISIEGENYSDKNISFEDLLYNAYTSNKLKNTLKNIDGYFNAVIYDANLKKVFLISDRYGMRMLYYYHKDGKFAWSGELKGLLALDFVDNSLDLEQINCFMDLGYLLEDKTWHQHIKLIKPASVLEFDIEEKKLSHSYYWKWSEIKQNKVSLEDAIDILGNLFLKAVDKRFDPKDEVGIALSGGLDSRAIFAAVNKLYPDYQGYSYTFGVEGCDDITIAKKVISKSKWKHDVFHFSSVDWLQSRINKVCHTDGMMNLMHMHGSEFLDTISKKINFTLNGYAGDVVLGGDWFRFNKLPINKRASKTNLRHFYKEYIGMCNIDDSFYDIPHTEPHLYMNRVRRFTNMGTVNSLYKIDHRKPFFDNDLIEFIYSLPDEYRKHNILYSKMLLKFFPIFFKDIPWQKTGETIDKKNTIFNKILNKMYRILMEFHLIKDTFNYTDYSKWIKEKNTSNYLSSLFQSSNSRYPFLKKYHFNDRYLMRHIHGFKDYSEKILRAATLCIYMNNT